MMDGKPRSVHVTTLQKRKLVQLIAKHPELIACKVTQNFNYKDSQRLWQNIAIECNALPGAKKSWKQWRKTFQDFRAKAKKQQREMNGELPISAIMFTPDEQELLGFTKVMKNTDDEVNKVQVLIVQENEALDESFPTVSGEIDSNENQDTLSEPKSPPEIKVFSQRRSGRNIVTRLKNKYNSKRHVGDCGLNCEVLANQEQQKILIKEDYLKFKKEYLSQKLKLMKEQTEALKSIARELSK